MASPSSWLVTTSHPSSTTTLTVRRQPTLQLSSKTSAKSPIVTMLAVALGRRQLATVGSILTSATLIGSVVAEPVRAASEEEYVNDTREVIGKVRNTIGMEKSDPKVATAVAELREASNTWVAKYRKEKELLGRASFRDVYSALNAVSGHYISFGPTATIPAKRRARILEEMDTAEKALLKGR